MKKKNDIILEVFAVLWFALFFFFLSDFYSIMRIAKWDGIWYSLCHYKHICTVWTDVILAILFFLMGMLFAFKLFKKYKWKIIWIPVVSLPIYFLIMFISMIILWA